MELRINSHGKVALFVLKGKVGWDNSRVLDTQILRMVEKGCTFIVFNLDEVTFLCSGGIGALVYNMKKVRDQGGDVFIVSHSDYIQFLLATIGFNLIFQDRIFATFDDFSEKVLAPQGLVLNSLSAYSVIRTDEGNSEPESAVA